MCNVFSCAAMSCVGRMHAKCTYVMLLLMQYMHVVCSTFRFRVSVRFCFSVGNLVEYSPGIVVSGGGGGAQKSQDFIFSYFVSMLRWDHRSLFSTDQCYDNSNHTRSVVSTADSSTAENHTQNAVPTWQEHDGKKFPFAIGKLSPVACRISMNEHVSKTKNVH